MLRQQAMVDTRALVDEAASRDAGILADRFGTAGYCLSRRMAFISAERQCDCVLTLFEGRVSGS